MTRKVVLGGFAGGLALFIWGIVAWFVLPSHASLLRALPAEDRVVEALKQSGTERGLYVIPAPPEPRAPSAEAGEAAQRAWEERMSRGPVALLVYQPEGWDPEKLFRPLVPGIVLCLLAGTFASWALSRARISSHFGRIAFVFGFGVFAWLLGPGTQWIWFHYPYDYAVATLLDSVIGWAIVAVVQAGIVRP